MFARLTSTIDLFARLTSTMFFSVCQFEDVRKLDELLTGPGRVSSYGPQMVIVLSSTTHCLSGVKTRTYPLYQHRLRHTISTCTTVEQFLSPNGALQFPPISKNAPPAASSRAPSTRTSIYIYALLSLSVCSFLTLFCLTICFEYNRPEYLDSQTEAKHVAGVQFYGIST